MGKNYWPGAVWKGRVGAGGGKGQLNKIITLTLYSKKDVCGTYLAIIC